MSGIDKAMTFFELEVKDFDFKPARMSGFLPLVWGYRELFSFSSLRLGQVDSLDRNLMMPAQGVNSSNQNTFRESNILAAKLKNWMF